MPKMPAGMVIEIVLEITDQFEENLLINKNESFGT